MRLHTDTERENERERAELLEYIHSVVEYLVSKLVSSK